VWTITGSATLGADLSQAVSTLRAVGPRGVGHREAAVAWKEAATAQGQDLPALLAGLDGANPLAANWIRTAIDAVAERAIAKAQLPKEELEKYLVDVRHDPRGRRLAYELLGQGDPSVADRFLPQMLDDPSLELRRDAIDRVIAEAEAIEKGGDKVRAVATYQKAFDASRDLDQIQLLAGRLRKLDVKVDLPRHLGLLTHWHAIGPFDNTDRKGFDAVYPPEQAIDLKASYPGKHGQVSWIEHTTTNEMGVVDFHKILQEEKSVVAYATTVFVSAQKQEVQFRLTSFNAVKLWLNGKLVDQRCVYHGGSQFDQYVSRGVLETGENMILVKVCQNEQTEAWTKVWNFQLRVCDQRGTAILPGNATAKGEANGSILCPAGRLRLSTGVVSQQDFHSVWAPVALTSASTGRPAGGWMHYHGTDGTGVAAEEGLPTTFGEGRNVAWKVPLPGRGPSSPIVVGKRVFVTSATGQRQDRLHVSCFDTTGGKLLWHRQLWATGSTVCNSFGGVAIPTPASDGMHVVAFYSSNDLACFDLDGNLKWYRGLGLECPTTRNDVGMGSSPLIVADTVVVQAENQGESFAAGIALDSGVDRWHLERDRAATWVSPMLLRGKRAADDRVLLASKFRLTAHEPATGKQVWAYEAACHTVSTGTAVDGNIYLPAGNGLVLLRPNATGTGVSVVWQEQRLQVGSTSPIVHQGKVYAIKGAGVLVCGDAATGEVLWQTRLKGPFWSSPVLADGRLYVVNHAGLVQVVVLESKGKVVETSQIDKDILASPAVADGAIYFRSNGSLWKVM
jgi:outer membrane protein assembly factor BamB